MSTSFHRCKLRNDGGTPRDANVVEGRLVHMTRGSVTVVVGVMVVSTTRELSNVALLLSKKRLVETRDVGQAVLRERREVEFGVVALRGERRGSR